MMYVRITGISILLLAFGLLGFFGCTETDNGHRSSKESLIIRVKGIDADDIDRIDQRATAQLNIGGHGQVDGFSGPVYDRVLTQGRPLSADYVKAMLTSDGYRHEVHPKLPDGECSVHFLFPTVVAENELSEPKQGMQGTARYERSISQGKLSNEMNLELVKTELVPVMVTIEGDLHQLIDSNDFYLVYRNEVDAPPFMSAMLRNKGGFQRPSGGKGDRTAVLHVQPGYFVSLVAHARDRNNLSYLYETPRLDLRNWSVGDNDAPPSIHMRQQDQEPIEITFMRDGKAVDLDAADRDFHAAAVYFQFIVHSMEFKPARMGRVVGTFVFAKKGKKFHLSRNFFDYVEHIRVRSVVPFLLADEIEFVAVQHPSIDPDERVRFKAPITRETLINHNANEPLIIELESQAETEARLR